MSKQVLTEMSDADKLKAAKAALSLSFLPDKLKVAMGDVLDVVGTLHARCCDLERRANESVSAYRATHSGVNMLSQRVEIAECVIREIDGRVTEGRE